MKAVVVQSDMTVKVEEKPKPTIKANEILLKTVAVGLNPTDYKHLYPQMAKAGNISGCDFVGEVVELGSEVPVDEVKKGEIRWGFVRGSVEPDRGAFAEYVAVEWDISSVVPPNVTPQQAASIPIPFMTAVQALYLRLRLTYPPSEQTGKWILIWSGATSVGQYAIQLAKLSGLKVATTASPKRWEHLRALGADVLVDYKDPDVVNKLKQGTNDSIEYGLDCISEESIKLSQLAFGPSGGHLLCILFDLTGLPRTDVKTEATLVYTALGQPHSWGPYHFDSAPEDRALYVKFAKLSTDLFAKGLLQPLAVDVRGTLEDTPAALDTLKKGTSTKIVLNVA